VRGLRLAAVQKYHVQLEVAEAFKRFTPPVYEDLYSLEFLPVLWEDKTRFRGDEAFQEMSEKFINLSLFLVRVYNALTAQEFCCGQPTEC
jgi:hypothetical protein